MSLEELGSIKVTSVSKKVENLATVPAAISVITAGDIRRSGALTLPEVLRMAPGMSVAKVDAAKWAVTLRGFNDTFAQKLLVLMDGRSVYTPLFSGTFWQVQDTMLEDVERIEVIRGPGGTVWGANAVNGVINIVSKPARDTQGVLLSGGGGTGQGPSGGVRYGAKLGEKTFYRIYGKYDDWNNSELVGGGDANDAWWKRQAGFRVDHDSSSADRLTFQGDLGTLRADQTSPRIVIPQFRQPPPAAGYNLTQMSRSHQSSSNLLGRWTHQFSSESNFSVQTYYCREYLALSLVNERRRTYDLDLRHRFQLGDKNEIVWGGGYRLSDANFADSVEVNLSRDDSRDEIINVFIQDEIKLVPDRLRLTLGTKIERNDYTDVELQPSARLSWTPANKLTVWASAARAVRTPSVFERDATVNLAVLPPNLLSPLPTLVSVVGHSGVKTETLVAYELGCRVQTHARLTWDAAVFVNDYNNLRNMETKVDLSHVPNYVRVQNVLGNQTGGRTYGGELAVAWQAIDTWRLHGQVSVFEADLHQPANVLTGEIREPNVATPRFQASVRSGLDLTKQVELDVWLRYADRLTSAAAAAASGMKNSDGTIPSYVTFDVRLAWRPARDIELTLVGQNLAGSHREFNPTIFSTTTTTVSRRVYGKVTVRF